MAWSHERISYDFKVMRDAIWASIEVTFNNVHPRLGGLDTIMNSSGSVGNLW